MMNKLPVHNIEGFRVVRGDLVPGGIKCLALGKALQQIPENKIACAVHEYGHSGIALALAAQKCGKEAYLFFAGKPKPTYVTEYLKDFSNVLFHFIGEIKTQSEAAMSAERWANKNQAFYLPVGFNCELFCSELISLAKETITSPKEVWVAVGSGTTIACLKQAWPEAEINGVNLGFLNHDVPYKVFEKPEVQAEQVPPYPSAPFYDAKIWRFVKENGNKEAVIWNIA